VREALAPSPEQIQTMPLTRPKGPAPRSRNLSPAPLFTLEGDNLPRHTLPAGQLSPDVAQHAVLDLLRHLGDRGMGAAVHRRSDAALDTSGTFWGAACFLIGAALLLRTDAPAPEAAYVSSAASTS
jgi:hypothetical protein